MLEARQPTDFYSPISTKTQGRLSLTSCLSIGSRTGYKIYTCDPFGKCYGKRGQGIGIAEMLFCTSLIAIVGAGEHPAFSPRKLSIINTKRQSTICELTFVTAVLGVKLNRKRLVVILEEHIYIYDISNMKLLHTIDICPNPTAPSADNCYLAYPSNSSTNHGELLIFDTIKLQAVNILQAHKSPLSCVSFNYDGTILATSSDKVIKTKKGTVIRVFSIPDCAQLFQFRRGTYNARIFCIAFNLASTLLCVSSDTDTIHIYQLKNQSGLDSLVRASTSGSYLETSPIISTAGVFGSYLPSNITNIWEPTRHFAFAKLPVALKERISICAFDPGERLTLNVLTSDGVFYLFLVADEGGECILSRQDSVMEPEEEIE